MQIPNNPLYRAFAEYLEGSGRIPTHQAPFYARWVEVAYRYAGKASHLPLSKDTEDAFIAGIKKKRESWQVKQARDALNRYRYYLESQCVDKQQSTEQSRVQSANTGENNQSGETPAQISFDQYDALWRKYAEKAKECLRLQQKSYRTEQTNLGWIRRFYKFLQGADPEKLTSDDARRFLTHLAMEADVSSSTQNQALNALLFFYRHLSKIREIYDQESRSANGYHQARYCPHVAA